MVHNQEACFATEQHVTVGTTLRFLVPVFLSEVKSSVLVALVFHSIIFCVSDFSFVFDIHV